MVKLRLKRFGTVRKPTYRIIAIDSRKRRDGAPLEEFGFYDPRSNPPTLNIKKESALKWLECGAQPSETTLRLFKQAGIVERTKA